MDISLEDINKIVANSVKEALAKDNKPKPKPQHIQDVEDMLLDNTQDEIIELVKRHQPEMLNLVEECLIIINTKKLEEDAEYKKQYNADLLKCMKEFGFKSAPRKETYGMSLFGSNNETCPIQLARNHSF